MAEPMQFPRTLPTMELFAGLSSTDLEQVLTTARVRHVVKETRIFNQGDAADRAYVLIRGSVRISQSGNEGDQVIIRFIAPGETFGTLALFTDRLYPADADALAEAVIASWSEDVLLDLMIRHPQIAINVIRITGKRLKEVQERVRELSTQRAEQRVASAVLRLAHQAGHRTVDGTAIQFPLRRKDVADISGTTLHTASRILTAWEKAGLLTSENQRLTICKPTEISKIAEGSAS
ncbi:MAG TPA: Crp/Fnr family transcriptional regulator [Lacipirellulaceae bacterium]|nr:Crp/Fnr family transcriptional regulator [Lacipirellulaceae bacterium]